jgi:hypothetical protein
MTRIRLPAVGLFVLLANNAWADLRTFDVAPQYQQEVFTALAEVLAVAGTEGGRVQRLSSGQIVVNATPETLDQVEQVLQAVSARPVAPAPRVELRYWAVLGSRATVANPPGTAAPNALGPVLAELKRLNGDLNFRVIGSASLATESGQPGKVSGMALEVSQTAFVQGETMNATIGLELQGRLPNPPAAPAQGQPSVTVAPLPPGFPGSSFNIGTISVRTALRRGEFVVMGQSELVGGGLDGPVFFIVNWPEK